MATVDITIEATPSDVFTVLRNGWYYSGWVVGTSHMRAVEDSWPAEGSRLHHASGAWPFVTRDETVVERMEPDRLLVLTARGRPLGEVRIELELTGTDGGTRTHVTMYEEPIAGPGKWLHNPATEALLARRNRESLARLATLTVQPSQPDQRD